MVVLERSGGWVATAAIALAIATRAAPALAAPDDADVALARDLAVAGIIQADAGDCAGAVVKLERAAKLHPAPTILGRLGECHVQLGHVVLGTEILQRVVREDLAADASPAFAKAKERARKVLDEALPKVARITVHVAAPPGVRASVTIDGQPMSDAALDVARPIDPGKHQLVASAAGQHPASAEISVGAGQTTEATLTLTADAAQPATPPPLAPRAARADIVTPPPASADRPTWQVALPWTATGALAVGAGVLGAVALSASRDLDRQLKTFPITQPQLTATEHRAAGFAAAADVVTGTAVAMGAISLYLTVTRRRAAAPKSTAGAF
jgi:PEGA domain